MMKILLTFAIIAALCNAEGNDTNLKRRVVRIRHHRFNGMASQGRAAGARRKLSHDSSESTASPKSCKGGCSTKSPSFSSKSPSTKAPSFSSKAPVTEQPTNDPTLVPTPAPTQEPSPTPSAAPTPIPCNFSKEKDCVKNGCVYTPKVKGKKGAPASCDPCSEFDDNKKTCAAKGCLFKKGNCSSCNDITTSKSCLKKKCTWDKKKKACASCSAFKGGKCGKANCAQLSKKVCAPCSDVKKEEDCTKDKKIKKGCQWKKKKCVPRS